MNVKCKTCEGGVYSIRLVDGVVQHYVRITRDVVPCELFWSMNKQVEELKAALSDIADDKCHEKQTGPT